METASTSHSPGISVVIVAPDDDTEVMHLGTALYATSDGYTCVRISGEATVHEWPTSQVLAGA